MCFPFLGSTSINTLKKKNDTVFLVFLEKKL